jgi:hypothetical protein
MLCPGVADRTERVWVPNRQRREIRITAVSGKKQRLATEGTEFTEKDGP